MMMMMMMTIYTSPM